MNVGLDISRLFYINLSEVYNWFCREIYWIWEEFNWSVEFYVFFSFFKTISFCNLDCIFYLIKSSWILSLEEWGFVETFVWGLLFLIFLAPKFFSMTCYLYIYGCFYVVYVTILFSCDLLLAPISTLISFIFVGGLYVF